MILCYDIGNGVDACGLTRGSKSLYLEGNSRMTPDLAHVTCGVCIKAVEIMVI